MAKNFIFMTNFANMATADITKKFTTAGSHSINTTSSKIPWGTGRSLLLNNPNSWTLPATSAKICVGGWVYFDITAFNAGTSAGIFALTDAGTVQVFMSVDINGKVTLANGNGTQVGVSTGQCIWPGGFYHIEVQFLITNSTSSGDCKVWVNGVLQISIAAGKDTQNTANAFATALQLQHNGGLVNLYLSDLFVVDWTTGDAPPVGQRRIYTLTPNGDGATNNFVGSDGNSVSNYLLVDDIPLDTADYTGSSVTSEVDLYAMSNLGLTPVSIDAVQVVSTLTKTDAGTRTARNLLRSGTTNYDTAVDIAPTVTSYFMFSSIWTADPDTGPGAWSAAGVDALQAGVKVQA